MREVMQENRSKSDNSGMMSECRFDVVIETMEFKRLHRLHRACTAESRPRGSRSTGCARKMVFFLLTRGLSEILQPVTSQASKLSWIHPCFDITTWVVAARLGVVEGSLSRQCGFDIMAWVVVA